MYFCFRVLFSLEPIKWFDSIFDLFSVRSMNSERKRQKKKYIVNGTTKMLNVPLRNENDTTGQISIIIEIKCKQVEIPW